MTLPASFPINMLQVATELATLNLPLSINHPWVVALAGKSSLPVSFSDLLGKTGAFNGYLTGSTAGGQFTTKTASFPNGTMLFGGNVASVSEQYPPGQYILTLQFNTAPNWPYKFYVWNQGTGVYFTLPKVSSTAWQLVTNGGADPYAGIVRGAGYNDYYTVNPSN